LPFKLGGTGSNFGGSFDGEWKNFQGPSIPENTKKIHAGMGEKLGVQIWCLKLVITHGFKCIGKVLEAFKKAFTKVPSLNQWDIKILISQKPLGAP